MFSKHHYWTINNELLWEILPFFIETRGSFDTSNVDNRYKIVV